ncbi:hypothetical protein BC830DRAFT_1092078 [Chytriomyces sp. MP71]|nr:hypothetical protein BC830DRAFT_1092078 [Chytriomyces sp. MP71]
MHLFSIAFFLILAAAANSQNISVVDPQGPPAVYWPKGATSAVAPSQTSSQATMMNASMTTSKNTVPAEGATGIVPAAGTAANTTTNNGGITKMGVKIPPVPNAPAGTQGNKVANPKTATNPVIVPKVGTNNGRVAVTPLGTPIPVAANIPVQPKPIIMKPQLVPVNAGLQAPPRFKCRRKTVTNGATTVIVVNGGSGLTGNHGSVISSGGIISSGNIVY